MIIYVFSVLLRHPHLFQRISFSRFFINQIGNRLPDGRVVELDNHVVGTRFMNDYRPQLSGVFVFVVAPGQADFDRFALFGNFKQHRPGKPARGRPLANRARRNACFGRHGFPRFRRRRNVDTFGIGNVHRHQFGRGRTRSAVTAARRGVAAHSAAVAGVRTRLRIAACHQSDQYCHKNEKSFHSISPFCFS